MHQAGLTLFRLGTRKCRDIDARQTGTSCPVMISAVSRDDLSENLYQHRHFWFRHAFDRIGTRMKFESLSGLSSSHGRTNTPPLQQKVLHRMNIHSTAKLDVRRTSITVKTGPGNVAQLHTSRHIIMKKVPSILRGATLKL